MGKKVKFDALLDDLRQVDSLDELKNVDTSILSDEDIIEYDTALAEWKSSSRLTTHISNTNNPHQTSDANILVSDITTNNATTLAHGFLPKLSGNSIQYLDGDGNWSTITGASTPSGYSEVTFSGQTSVNVVHNFGVKPLVQVLLSSAVSVPFSITHNTDNDFTVTFTSAESGSIISSAGLEVPNVNTVNTNYTITTDDNIVIANTQGITITLPTAVGVTGKTYSIDNATDQAVFVDTTGAETIWGEPSQRLPGNSTIVVYSTGSNWRIT